MNKSELINAMAAESGLTKVDSKKALEAFMVSITNSLKKEEKVSLVGFGTFSVLKKGARIGINPSTKEKINIPAKKVAKFKPGMELTAAIE